MMIIIITKNIKTQKASVHEKQNRKKYNKIIIIIKINVKKLKIIKC